MHIFQHHLLLIPIYIYIFTLQNSGPYITYIGTSKNTNNVVKATTIFHGHTFLGNITGNQFKYNLKNSFPFYVSSSIRCSSYKRIRSSTFSYSPYITFFSWNYSNAHFTVFFKVRLLDLYSIDIEDASDNNESCNENCSYISYEVMKIYLYISD